MRLEANTQRIGINAYKDAANPIVDGQDGPDEEDETSFQSELDVNEMEDSAGSISDSSPGPHTRTDHMVEELLEEVITQEIKSTSAVVHAVWQDGDGKLTDEEASDREDQ